MGPYRGGQAERVLVSFADFNCIKLPGKEGDEHEDDFVMLADIFPTGYYATTLAMVEPCSSVAIYGAGPVGLLAAHSALQRGAEKVFVIDESDVRLKKAEEIGATPINFRDGLPSDLIKNILKKSGAGDELLPEEKEGQMKLEGVACGIDAVGYQAKSFEDSTKENPTAVLDDVALLVNPAGAIGIIGVIFADDPGGKTADAKKGIFPVPMGTIWGKGISIGTGQTPVKHISIMLRDLIVSGRASPGKIVSHHIGLDDAPEAYRLFDKRGVGEGAE